MYITPEDSDAPSIKECRHAVLQMKDEGYVIYDRLLGRIVDGVYHTPLETVLAVARAWSKDTGAHQDMTPNGVALGLKYPKKRR